MGLRQQFREHRARVHERKLQHYKSLINVREAYEADKSEEVVTIATLQQELLKIKQHLEIHEAGLSLRTPQAENKAAQRGKPDESIDFRQLRHGLARAQFDWSPPYENEVKKFDTSSDIAYHSLKPLRPINNISLSRPHSRVTNGECTNFAPSIDSL